MIEARQISETYWQVVDDRNGGVHLVVLPAGGTTQQAIQAWLETFSPPVLPPSADDVRAEASRRMRALVGARDAAHLEIVIANGTREAVRLLRLLAEREWTPEEAARAAALEQVDTAIEAIRAASNALEPEPPEDYRDDRHWPSFG